MSSSEPDFSVSQSSVADPTASISGRGRFLKALSAFAAFHADYHRRRTEGTVVTFPLTAVATEPAAYANTNVARPAAPVPAPEYRRYQQRLKRAFDVTLVLLTSPIWLPLMLTFAALIFARDGHNPFYVQDRVGRDGRIFRMIKLRSMVPNAGAYLAEYLSNHPAAKAEWDKDQKLKRDPRITKVGRFIRKTSIDEIPQLINILKGDMSLVGPRPFMVEQAELYRGRRYYDLRPGLTGFWQISNRNNCTFTQRMHFDGAYHQAMSLKTDIGVLIRTIGVVIRGTGY